jgi:hypothetical protein
VFIAVIDAIEHDDEGSRVLDAIEEAHGLNSDDSGIPTARRYRLMRFENNAEAIAWLEAEARGVAEDALEHVAFGAAAA